jgi:glycosyltransferase involved in cell wall biosynthesis
MAGELQSDIERLGLTGKARLTGQASDMPQVMNAMDCLVHPQIGTEALGLVICEAHACGKPVIASALDGIPEAFRPGGYGRLVTPENVEELAESMRFQASQPNLDAAQAAQLHAKIAETFSIGIMAEKNPAALRRLLLGLIWETQSGQTGNSFCRVMTDKPV